MDCELLEEASPAPAGSRAMASASQGSAGQASVAGAGQASVAGGQASVVGAGEASVVGAGEGLEAAMVRLRRRYGAVALRRGDEPLPEEAWSTGVPALDAVTGVGGLPRGRLCVLAGEGGGATGRLTLLQALTAAASHAGEVAYLDLAGSLDPGFLADLGADLESCIVLRPPRGAVGPGLAMARALVRAGVPWLGVALGRRCAAGAALEHALTALVGAVAGARAVACVAAAAPLPEALAYASSLTLECAPLDWQVIHGDVAGLRLRLRLAKSKRGVPGAATGLLLRYPRPWAAAEVVGLPALLAARGDGAAAGSGAAPGSPPLGVEIGDLGAAAALAGRG